MNFLDSFLPALLSLALKQGVPAFSDLSDKHHLLHLSYPRPLPSQDTAGSSRGSEQGELSLSGHCLYLQRTRNHPWEALQRGLSRGGLALGNLG